MISKLKNEYAGAAKRYIADAIKMQIYYGIVGNLVNLYKNIKTPVFKRQRGNDSPIDHRKKRIIRKNIPSRFNRVQRRMKTACQAKGDLFNTPPFILFICYSIPRHDKTSAELRLFNIISILLANHCKIKFVYCSRTHNESDYFKLYNGNCVFQFLPMDIDDYVELIDDTKPDCVWISELWRIEYVGFVDMLMERLVKRKNSFQVILDTVDFHAKEFKKKYDWSQDPVDLELSLRFLQYETSLYKKADIISVVSDPERTDILEHIPELRNIHIIPNIHRLHSVSVSFYKRRHICFIGNFGTQHNVDAVRHFIDHIFKTIRERLPTIEFHIIGFGAKKYTKQFQEPGVKIVGKVINIHKVISNYRLFVCPMVYGAGMKGKIGLAMETGVPVVTTTIGIEGFPVTDGKECYISNNPKDFAEKCCLCLLDPGIWYQLSINALEMINKQFSSRAVEIKLGSLLEQDQNSII